MFQWYVRNPPGRITSQEGMMRKGKDGRHFPRKNGLHYLPFAALFPEKNGLQHLSFAAFTRMVATSHVPNQGRLFSGMAISNINIYF
jgi:hypothetical protein